MLAYLYDPITKEYVGTYEAQKDPLSGGYLLPANATWDYPPDKPTGKAIVWNDKEWKLVNDYRGKKVWNDTTKTYYEVTYIGDLKTNEYFITDAQIAELVSSSLKEVRIVDGQVTIYTREKTKQEKIWDLENSITKSETIAAISGDAAAIQKIKDVDAQIKELENNEKTA